MPDILRAAELTAKAIRAAFSAVGAAVAEAIPAREQPSVHHVRAFGKNWNEVPLPWDAPPTSAAPPVAEDDPAGVCADRSPAPPAGLSWVDWAAPAICDVLAEHQYEFGFDTNCVCGEASIFDPQDWRDHVAPLIAARLVAAIEQVRANDADTRVNATLRDIGWHRAPTLARQTGRCVNCCGPIRDDVGESDWYHTATGFHVCNPDAAFSTHAEPAQTQ